MAFARRVPGGCTSRGAATYHRHGAGARTGARSAGERTTKMSTLIYCRLDASTAVRLALGSAGRHYVRFEDGDLVALSDAERGVLARYAREVPDDYDRDWVLALNAPSTVEGVVASLRAEIAREQREREDKAREDAVAIQCAVAYVDAEWIGSAGYGDDRAWYEDDSGGYATDATGTRHGYPTVREHPESAYLTDKQQRDPRVVARRAAVVKGSTYLAACAVWERHCAAWREIVDRATRERVQAAKHSLEATLAEAEAWIAAHGSARLRKIFDGGFLGVSLAVYRDERLAIERPGWAFNDAEGAPIRNPSEEALDALAAVREVDPAVRLLWSRDYHRAFLLAEFLGQQITKWAKPGSEGEGEDAE